MIRAFVQRVCSVRRNRNTAHNDIVTPLFAQAGWTLTNALAVDKQGAVVCDDAWVRAAWLQDRLRYGPSASGGGRRDLSDARLLASSLSSSISCIEMGGVVVVALAAECVGRADGAVLEEPVARHTGHAERKQCKGSFNVHGRVQASATTATRLHSVQQI